MVAAAGETVAHTLAVAAVAAILVVGVRTRETVTAVVQEVVDLDTLAAMWQECTWSTKRHQPHSPRQGLMERRRLVKCHPEVPSQAELAMAEPLPQPASQGIVGM